MLLQRMCFITYGQFLLQGNCASEVPAMPQGATPRLHLGTWHRGGPDTLMAVQPFYHHLCSNFTPLYITMSTSESICSADGQTHGAQRQEVLVTTPNVLRGSPKGIHTSITQPATAVLRFVICLASTPAQRTLLHTPLPAGDQHGGTGTHLLVSVRVSQMSKAYNIWNPCVYNTFYNKTTRCALLHSPV